MTPMFRSSVLQLATPHVSIVLTHFWLCFLSRPHTAEPTSVSQSNSRYSTAADALAALVDAAASAPQMDVAKVQDSKHERDDDISSSAAARRALAEQQQQEERRSMQSPYGAMSLPGGKPHSSYPEGARGGDKEKGPQTSKSRIEEELRTRGKTTITAANFIDVIITRQIASDKDNRERGSQSSDSSSSCEYVMIVHYLAKKKVTTWISLSK